MYRSVTFVSPRERQGVSYTTGDEPLISIPQRTIRDLVAAESPFQLVSPDGTEEILRPAAQQPNRTRTSGTTSALSFALPRLTEQGVYTIRQNQSPVLNFAVNLDPRESDFRKASQQTLTKYAAQSGIPSERVHFLQPGEEIEKNILQSRYGVELWKECVMIALFLALAEMVIARDSRKRVVSGGTATA
jgi:hypothetical protein